MATVTRARHTSTQIFGQPGYSADLKLSTAELDHFRKSISRQWLCTIEAHYPQHAAQFEAAGLANYHKLSHLVEHEKLWPKQARLLPQEAVEEIKRMPFIDTLIEEFGNFSISDVVYGNTICEGQQEVYWRIVRPDVSSDVGPLHADKWFHQVVGSEYGMFPPGVVTVKIWIPIYCEPGRSGLMVVPNSHTRDWRHSYVEKGGSLKPRLDEDAALDAVLVETEPGTLLVFNERLLHGGAVNRGEMTRVSTEITMVLDRGEAGVAR